MKFMRKCMAKLFILFLIYICMVHFLIEISVNQEVKKDMDYMIILGAKLYEDLPARSLEERLNMGLKYLGDNQKTKVVVSGGQGESENISEALAMKKYLVSNGIDKERIIIEDRSTNTFENIKFSLQYIENSSEILIVTSKYHIFRSKLILRRFGIDSIGLSATVPKSLWVKSYIREYLAIGKTFLFDWP